MSSLNSSSGDTSSSHNCDHHHHNHHSNDRSSSKRASKSNKHKSNKHHSNKPPPQSTPPPQQQSQQPTEEELEYNHWYDVMRTFLMYSDFSLFEINERKKHLQHLNPTFKPLLPSLTFSKFDSLLSATHTNQHFFNSVVQFQDYGFTSRSMKSREVIKHHGKVIHINQQHRNQAVLHSLVREWSLNGLNERNVTFTPLLTALQSKLPVTSSNLYTQRVLVPGCGLARLPLEIASLGYACEANEYSMFMLTVSHFILNSSLPSSSLQIFPWIDRVSNIVNLTDVLQPVVVPDVCPMDLLTSNPLTASFEERDDALFHRFSMAAGNFVELYGEEKQKEQWDAIVTCFFLDTAPVVME